MNKEELVRILREEGIRDDVYYLYGGLPPEKLTLSEVFGKWYVYYSERGLETNKREFATESEACTFMLRQLRRDPSSKR